MSEVFDYDVFDSGVFDASPVVLPDSACVHITSLDSCAVTITVSSPTVTVSMESC